MSIQIKKLCKAFGEHRVLKGLDLTLEDGGIYCLMGASGMGKTTLLHILLGLESRDSGEIVGIKSGRVSAMSHRRAKRRACLRRRYDHWRDNAKAF